MKKFKEFLTITLFVLGICGLIYGIGYIKYKLWRAEHPHAKTWTFFIPKN
jgi:hypothetical protein